MKDKREYEYKMKVNHEEKMIFEQLMEEYGFTNKSAFIRDCIYNRKKRIEASLSERVQVCNELQALVKSYPNDSRIKEVTENIYNLIMGDELHGGNKSN